MNEGVKLQFPECNLEIVAPYMHKDCVFRNRKFVQAPPEFIVRRYFSRHLLRYILKDHFLTENLTFMITGTLDDQTQWYSR